MTTVKFRDSTIEPVKI